MSQTTSATMGRRYGLERVCRLWEQSRSAFYARRARLQRPASADSPRRRGPTPALSDAHLLAAIRNDLARSPFQGEGQPTPIRGVRKMRAEPHHWNAECVGWHVCKPRLRSGRAGLERGRGKSRTVTDGGAGHGLRENPPLVRSARSTRRTAARSVGPLPQPGPLGASAPASLARRAGDQRRRRTLESHAQGAGRLRPGLSKSRRRARRRRRVRRALQPVLAPREAGLSHATRGPRRVRTPGRVAQTCVQETGCGTRTVTDPSANSRGAPPSTHNPVSHIVE